MLVVLRFKDHTGKVVQSIYFTWTVLITANCLLNLIGCPIANRNCLKKLYIGSIHSIRTILKGRKTRKLLTCTSEY